MKEALLDLADEIVMNRKIGADHRFSEKEAELIEYALRLAATSSATLQHQAPLSRSHRNTETR